MTKPLRLVINIDGASRGNPGPAAAGVVVSADGVVIHEAGLFLGQATNNVAEYRALLAGLEKAVQLGAADVEIRSDSELLVRQMNGQYRVRNKGLLPLFEQAYTLTGKFKRCLIKHVPREQNKQADHMANQALNLKRNVEEA